MIEDGNRTQGDIQIFSQTLHPLDLKVNIPYFPIFYSALYCLAEFSELLTRIFTIKKYNGEFFSVRLMKKNMWEDMTLDSFFPHLPFDQTIFLETRYNMVWPIVLEKAFAKHKESYDNINLAPIQNILLDMTGYPVELLEQKVKGREGLIEE